MLVVGCNSQIGNKLKCNVFGGNVHWVLLTIIMIIGKHLQIPLESTVQKSLWVLEMGQFDKK
jgi:hypothetical protein